MVSNSGKSAPKLRDCQCQSGKVKLVHIISKMSATSVPHHKLCYLGSNVSHASNLRETNVELREENPKTSPENLISTFCGAP